MYSCRVHKDTPLTCIHKLRTHTHSRDCSRVDLICKQIIKLIAHCITVEPPNPCGFVLLISPVSTVGPQNQCAGNDSESHMNGCEVPSHFFSGTEWPQFKLGDPWGKSKRSFPCSCSVSLPPLFLITSLKPHRSSGFDSISF